MCARAVALLVGLTLSASGVLATAGSAQTGSPPAGQAQPIGKIETATGSVAIRHTDAVVVQANIGPNGGIGQAKAGDFVYLHDVVSTGADGAVGMVFTDGTTFNLSANANITLNEFVYDPNGTSNSALMSLTKGTFTFIAGKVAKTGGMKVDTPVATMGIRGTAPHVEISEDGTVHFSTLVEDSSQTPGQEKKRAPVQENRRAAPLPQNVPGTPANQRQRQAKNAFSASTDQAMLEQNKKLKNLSICRGC